MIRFGLLGSGLMDLGLLSMAIHFVLWVALIVIVLKIFRSHKDRHHGATRQTDYALEILRERFAKGEIELEEFNKRKQDLLS